jgi:transcriptional regulator with XRE-family HTH domain
MRRAQSRFTSPEALAAAKRLGEAVRARRIELHSTLEASAARARMSPVTWMRIERGEVSVAMGSWLAAFEQTGLLDRLPGIANDGRGQKAPRQRVSSTRPREDDFDF